MIGPIAKIAELPTTIPFVGPEALARSGGHEALLRLGANENPFGPSPLALEAMQRELEHASWYGDPESTALREALAARHGCSPENISIGAGIDDLQGLLVRAYLGTGKAVMTLGTYPTFLYHVVSHGGEAVFISYTDDGRVRLEELAALAVEQCPRLVYLANPDNPSGSCVSPQALDRFLDLLPKDTLLVLDEAYVDFLDEVYLNDTVHPRVVRLRTFSKAYGMAGMRIGYALAPAEVIACFQKIRLHFAVNRIAQAGALAAIADDAFVSYVKRETARGRREYDEIGRLHGCATLPSTTNFVCFDLGSRARAEAIVEELLRRAVFIRKPSMLPLDRFIRVSVGNARERTVFAHSFADALAAL